MHIFYGTDVTDDKKNKDVSGNDEFSVQQCSQVNQEALEKSLLQANELTEKSMLPLPLIILQFLCLIAAFTILGIILKTKLPLSVTFATMPHMFVIAAVCLAVSIGLMVIGARKAKKVAESDESIQNKKQSDDIIANIMREFGVPDTAEDIDILNITYKRKNGIAIIEHFSCLNFDLKMFVANGNLYLADSDNKYEIPLSAIKNIREEKGALLLGFWNKKTPYNKEPYEHYRITRDKNGRYQIKNYYVVAFNNDGELWEMYIPNYDIASFEKLTGIKHS